MLQPASTKPLSNSAFLLLGSLISGTGLLPRPQNLPVLSLQAQTLKSQEKKIHFSRNFSNPFLAPSAFGILRIVSVCPAPKVGIKRDKIGCQGLLQPHRSQALIHHLSTVPSDCHHLPQNCFGNHFQHPHSFFHQRQRTEMETEPRLRVWWSQNLVYFADFSSNFKRFRSSAFPSKRHPASRKNLSKFSEKIRQVCLNSSC